MSIYFVDRGQVCQRKSNLELICSDGLGGNDRELAYVISENRQNNIFIDQKDAKVNHMNESRKHRLFELSLNLHFIICKGPHLQLFKSLFKMLHIGCWWSMTYHDLNFLIMFTLTKLNKSFDFTNRNVILDLKQWIVQIYILRMFRPPALLLWNVNFILPVQRMGSSELPKRSGSLSITAKRWNINRKRAALPGHL